MVKVRKSNTLRLRSAPPPKDSKFIQQNMRGCTPLFTPKMVISTWLLIGAVFVILGGVFLDTSQSVVEIKERYDDICVPSIFKHDKIKYIKGPEDKSCNLSFHVKRDMKSPIYVYYELENFHQNNKRYVKNRSDKQLKSPQYESEQKSCHPIPEKHSGRIVVPCGLIAWSLFNDTYRFDRGNASLKVNKVGIAWPSEKGHKFGCDVYPKNFQTEEIVGGAKLDPTIPLCEQEDLIVWMRISPFPTLRKLYGKIETDLKKDEVVQVRIQNNYNVYQFEGKKRLVMSTVSWLGGQSYFLGIAYITVGVVCLMLAMALTVTVLVRQRQLGNPADLSWNKNKKRRSSGSESDE